ncbi:MAG: hypothetical protein LCH95_00480 [Proteobacteria bacterium]|nr:hypothetical protein [Pseudomonadota bacterium]
MTFSSVRRSTICRAVLAGTVLAGISALGACTPTPSVGTAWTAPGWYLQKAQLIQPAGNSYFGGPYTYEKCEEERIRQPPETATQLLCVRENRRPDKFGRD